jgi:hypothetical protein
MTDEIARLRELLAKATLEPWGMYNGYGPCEDGLTRCASIGRMEGHRETVLVSPHDSADLAAKHEDFELIAAAVNALPALLDRLEAAERERDLAIAHDLHPYPTAHAYEKVCVALETAKKRAEAAERRVGVLEGSLHTAMQKYRELRDRVILRGGEQ